MAKFLRSSERVHCVEYVLTFRGFSFSCDEHGNLLPAPSEQAEENRRFCFETYGRGGKVEKREWYYTEPAAIECDVCEGEVQLDSFTNTCLTCEQRGIITDYNMSGQRLAPRGQWGEETGETYLPGVGVIGPRGDEEW